jgi:beta-lactamase superfamily II metal-dependent hydrolase
MSIRGGFDVTNDRTRFAAYPSAVIYREPHTTSAANAVQHLLWGDWLSLRDGVDGPWREVRARGTDGWMHEDDITEERLLEVNFVDIGQGDGCLVVTPDDKRLIIDAGEGDNMFRFLRWRFRLESETKFDAFIITHPDKDHYYGFKQLLAHAKVLVKDLYHNGIVERKDKKVLGPEKRFSDIAYLDDVVTSQRRLKSLLAADKKKGSHKLYPSILRSALENGRVERIRMLSSRDEYVPRYGPGEDLRLRVLAPVPEKCPDGRWRLRRLGDTGKTKNGHSVVLKLRYHEVSMLLGGDLNIPAQDYLLRQYTGLEPTNDEKSGQLIAKARKTFEVDIAKACHHGSADFSALFLRTVNPIATIISSGDEESHAHPRPDALGSYGRYGRGIRPLIFSTELARSSRETIKSPNRLRRDIDELQAEVREATSKSVANNAKKKLDKLLDVSIERSVAVYGMITVRTDGNKVVIAQKLESPRSKKSKWDIHRLEPDDGGRLDYKSKH